MDYSKREIAEICGVTTQAIDKRLRKTGLIGECQKVSNRLLIPETVATELTTIYCVKSGKLTTNETKLTTNETKLTTNETKLTTNETKLTTNETKLTTNETILELIAELRNQLAFKDEQIRELNKALVNAQDIAKAAQALNAADKPLPLDSGGETGKPTRWQRLKAAWRN